MKIINLWKTLRGFFFRRSEKRILSKEILKLRAVYFFAELIQNINEKFPNADTNIIISNHGENISITLSINNFIFNERFKFDLISTKSLGPVLNGWEIYYAGNIKPFINDTIISIIKHKLFKDINGFLQITSTGAKELSEETIQKLADIIAINEKLKGLL